MTSISTPRDDEGAVRQRIQRERTPPVGRLRSAAAQPAARRISGQTSDPAAPHTQREPAPWVRSPERRQDERRRRPIAVLLDTRSSIGNRRSRVRRGQDRFASRCDPHNGGTPPVSTVLGDDVYA